MGILEGESGRRIVMIVGIIVIGFVALAIAGAVLAPTDSGTATGGSGGGGTNGGSNSGSTGGADSQSVNPHIGQVDVDVQTDFGQRNNIGFDVETVFEDSATLTVQVSDGEGTAQRTFEGTTTSGTTQEFNDDINPPDTFSDNEQFTVIFLLQVNGETVDTKQVTGTYSE